MTKANVIVTVSVAIVSTCLWAFFNQPEDEPPWPTRIQGFAFSPMRADEDPTEGTLPTVEEIDEDLALLAGRANAVRTYTVDGTLGEVPRLAAKHDLNVALGAWITGEADVDTAQVEKLIEIAKRYPHSVVRVIIGNEALLRGALTFDELAAHIDRARHKLGVPVSTAEPWHVWLANPHLVEHVDYIAAHVLPYWEGTDVGDAVAYVDERMAELAAAYPDKPIVLAEVGWPSYGRTRENAVASESNEATFLRRFLAHAASRDYVYYVMEAFDQPWKRRIERGVGTYWGVYDVYRRPKFEFISPIVEIPQWPILAFASTLIMAIVLALLLLDSRSLRTRGRSFLAVIAYTASAITVWVAYDYSRQYLTATAVLVGLLMFTGMVGVFVVLLAEAHEWAESLWVRERRRAFRPLSVDDDELPMISVHVPAYNEPPVMVIETLDALARMDYPRFEVVVIDNNTKNSAVWEPVRAHCATLGERFRFYHVDPLAGFKAGALNYALEHTAANAEIIAVIDSDYTVDHRWLRDLVPQFRQQQVAIVQAPQDYRDERANAFKAMCYAEYRGFFYIGMITRNERNAIIQHGTMTMVRRKVLEEVGGWSHDTITEDAELGLRVFEHGYEATYIPKSYGRGLMPDTFADFKKQRFRWAFGSIQILRMHARALTALRRSELTAGQRYHFVAGWLPWLADGLNLAITVAALAWSTAIVAAPNRFDPPLIAFSAVPLALFGFKIAKLVYLYRTTVDATVRQTIAAAIAGLSLAHTVARAVLTGVVAKERPFFRTPKMVRESALRDAFAAAREETVLAVGLVTAAACVAIRTEIDSPDELAWTGMLVVQSIPYWSALLVSIVSALPSLPASLIAPPAPWPTSQGERATGAVGSTSAQTG